jgi:TPR repeat protein
MPEVPSNMQEGLAHLELEAREAQKHGRTNSNASITSTQDHNNEAYATKPTAQPQPKPLQYPQSSSPKGYTANYAHTNASAYQNAYSTSTGQAQRLASSSEAKAPDTSKPSPFPKIRDAGPYVPPSHEEKELILERARPIVLNSNDPEMQLAWAQDALSWVDIAVGSRARYSAEQSPRPSTPKIELQLRIDAISIINFLAEQTHPKAMFLRAIWHEFGKFGYPLDRKEAFQGYKRAAEKGYARAEYRIGTQYESMQDMAKSIRHYNNGLSMGDSASNYRLGMMSLLGQHGQPQDYQLAKQRIRFAAETADENAPQGAYVYGMLLARELPNITVPETVLPIDMELAKTFIEKAAYLGFAKAQVKMGSAYELCLLGCDFDPALSLHYNALAARQGEADAEMAISKWFLCGFEGVFERSEELAFTYAKRAADTGLPTAEFALGYFYEIGMYVPLDLRKAEAWYKKAADHGNKDAVGRLESISHHQLLSKKDHEEIAITRIKSQYGSRRGGRPDRLKEKPSPLPVMPEDRVDMPSPSTGHSRSGSGPTLMVSPGDSYPPTRPKSTAPYPEDDVAPSTWHGRPNSAVQRNPQWPLTGPQADRPLSAFGIRPVQLQSQDQQGNAYSPSESNRPLSGHGNRVFPEGRGSNPGGRNRIVSAGWEPPRASGYRAPSPNFEPSIRPVDTGRQQPLDTSQGGRNKLQKVSPNSAKSHPSLPQSAAPYPTEPLSARPLPSPSERYHSLPNSPANFGQWASPTLSPHDPRSSGQRLESAYDHRISNQRPISTYDVRATSYSSNGRTELHDVPQRRPIPGNPPPRISSIPPPRAPSAVPSITQPVHSNSIPLASSKPVKEGPKTFDDMGIPQQKNESECVS